MDSRLQRTMMVNVLAFNDWSCRCGVSRVMSCASVPESSSITFELLSGLASVIMLELSLLNSTHVVGVFFRENFLVLNWLDGGVIVVLVDLTVNGLGHLDHVSNCTDPLDLITYSLHDELALSALV